MDSCSHASFACPFLLEHGRPSWSGGGGFVRRHRERDSGICSQLAFSPQMSYKRLAEEREGEYPSRGAVWPR